MRAEEEVRADLIKVALNNTDDWSCWMQGYNAGFKNALEHVLNDKDGK
jgi:hypothetical protein